MNDKHPLISVIIPVYKVEAYLDTCVKSVMKQTYRNLEIILVDDGSPDNCPAMCDEYARQDSRITVIHKENGGLSSARNAGMEIANGEYIGFVDSDDWIASDMYEHLLNGFLQYESVGVTRVGRVYVDEQGREEISSCDAQKDRCLKASEWVRLLAETKSHHSVWNRLYLARIAKSIPFAVGKYAQDMMYNYQIADVLDKNNLFYVDLSYYGYYYRTRPDNITTSLRIWQDIDALGHYIALFEQWKDRRPEWASWVMRRRVHFCVESNKRMWLNPKWHHLRYQPELNLRNIPNKYVLFNCSRRFLLVFLILKYIPVLWRSSIIQRLRTYRGMQNV